MWVRGGARGLISSAQSILRQDTNHGCTIAGARVLSQSSPRTRAACGFALLAVMLSDRA